MERFTTTFKDSNAEHVSIEHKRLAFDCEKYLENNCRYKRESQNFLEATDLDWAERKEMRSIRHLLELETFKLTMEVLLHTEWSLIRFCGEENHVNVENQTARTTRRSFHDSDIFLRS